MALRGVVLVSALVFLAGCKTTEERRAELSQEADALCRSYGAEVGSPSYVECRLRVMEEYNRQSARREAEIDRSLAIMMQATQPRPSVTCHTFGNVTNCF